ncbi:MAG TPA: hypothetical protein VG893_05940 [Terracidiphilus sp.]|nr:hypothetical protein [Terracidiphilus sp.]
MNHLLLSFDWTTASMHIPSYALLLLAIPLVGLVIVKFGSSAKSGSAKKAQTWIPTGEYDDDGLPIMAREKDASHEARMRVAMASYQSRTRR